MIVTVGKRGTIVIPKQMRTQCHVDEGTELDVSVSDNVIMLSPSIHTRTRLDENFDSMRATLMAKGVTLESAMDALRELRAADE
jgi:AbrB family looped-hinge helix DNA binding protein